MWSLSGVCVGGVLIIFRIRTILGFGGYMRGGYPFFWTSLNPDDPEPRILASFSITPPPHLASTTSAQVQGASSSSAYEEKRWVGMNRKP